MRIEDADAYVKPRGTGSRCLTGLVLVLCLLGTRGYAQEDPVPYGFTRDLTDQPVVEPEDLRLTPETMEKRQAQTRVFDTDNDAAVLAATAAVLQDLGFLIEESEMQLGLIVGSKVRSAINPVQVGAKVALGIFFGVEPKWNERQTMRVSLVTTPVGEKKGTAVRVTFQRLVFTNTGTITKKQALGSEEIYQEFFAKLSKALFLGAQGP